jgi:hypothetical protein
MLKTQRWRGRPTHFSQNGYGGDGLAKFTNLVILVSILISAKKPVRSVRGARQTRRYPPVCPAMPVPSFRRGG